MPKVAVFYPWPPFKGYSIKKILKRLGYSWTTNPRARSDLRIYWQDRTVRRPNAGTRRFLEDPRVINRELRDISKRKVDEVYQQVFGHATLLDPRTHHGLCTRKLDRNGWHYGKTVRCPRRSYPWFVYQKVINNERGDHVEDLRLVCFKGEFPLLLRAHRPFDLRYCNWPAVYRARLQGRRWRSELVRIEDHISSNELEHVRELLRRMHLDYGELDLLRNADDGKLYVIDVNPTPTGPARSLPDNEAAIDTMAQAFASVFLER